MSALERSAPRFCFNPRSMASRSEIRIMPGTSFAGTLLENGLTLKVPGMGCPGVDVVPVCADDIPAPQRRAPAIKTEQHDAQRKRSHTKEPPWPKILPDWRNPGSRILFR